MKVIAFDVCQDCPHWDTCWVISIENKYKPTEKCPLPDLPDIKNNNRPLADYAAECMAFVEKLRGLK